MAFASREDQADATQDGPEKAHDAELSSPGMKPEPQRVTTQQWLVVISAFMVFLNTWGLLLAFGAFQTYYQENLLRHRSSPDIAWISTTCACIILLSGLLTGPLFDAGYMKPLLVCGCVLEVLGLMMLSLATEYYQIFLAQGICVGIGGGLVYIPAIASAAASFDAKRRSQIMGLVASATGIGGVIYPIIFQRLVGTVGFPWTVRCIAFIVFATYATASGTLFSRSPSSTVTRKFVDPSGFKDLPFVFACLVAFFSGTAYYVPLIYLPTFSITQIEGFDIALAFYLLSIVNGASVVGRLLTGLIASLVGPLETTTVALFSSAIILLSWMAVNGTAGIIVWSVFWGLSSSVLVALPGAIIPLLSPSIAIIGTRTGMYWACVGIGVLIGSPIGGALLDLESIGSIWWHIPTFTGCFMMVAGVLMIYPTYHVRTRVRDEC